ncbi:MAG TPA: catalase/peroxidase HPI, partial [Jatrophihabitantaceae bacterium]
RPDIWQPEEIFWGPEDSWLGDERYSGDRDLSGHLGAVQMGLIYVNPEGPNGEPDPLKAAHDIRETFARMAMNDEETVALIAGGHTFGKTHGAGSGDYVGPEPEAAPLEQQGLGWLNTYGTGKGADAITSGLEVTWSQTPTQWSSRFLQNLFNYEWELTKSPAGAWQWTAKDAEADVPGPADPDDKRKPTMLTTDLALRVDPIYGPISKRYLDNPDEFGLAFAKAWYKLLHRDMGPLSRYLGPWIAEPQLWQDPVPALEGESIGDAEIADLKAKLLDSGLSIQQLVLTAWASASSFRATDKRGGANGARIRLEPQKGWAANDPTELASALEKLEQIASDFNSSGGKQVSLADLIVLGGCAAVEKAAKDAGQDVTVAFTPGRTDATQESTDTDSFTVLEPKADGFRNYLQSGSKLSPETLLVEKSYLLDLSAPEMTALIGGMRALGANAGGTKHGVFTDRPGVLTNDFFTNLLDMSTTWKTSTADANVIEGRGRDSDDVKWTATTADLVFGSNSQLRAIAEVYAQDQARFASDFARAWSKVMELDRFDLR